MAKKKSESKKITGKNKLAQLKEQHSSGTLESSQLMKLLEDMLKDIYWAEKALNKAIPKMIKNATSEELIEALENHLDETSEHVTKIEEVFSIIGKKAVAKKCEAMEGLIKEGDEVIEECDEGPMCDAGLIAAAQKVEHYEIAAYGTMRQFAETLGLDDAAKILEEILEQEKNADKKLTEVAVSTVNIEASSEEESEESEESEEDEDEVITKKRK